MKLKAYLAEIGMKIGDFSKVIGIQHAYLCRIMNGELKPSLRLSKDIEQATEGNVKFEPSDRRLKMEKKQQQQKSENANENLGSIRHL